MKIQNSAYTRLRMPAATEFDDPNTREDDDEELREGEVAPYDLDDRDDDDPEDDD